MTTQYPRPGSPSPESHVSISRHFIQQASEELERGDLLQASEKTWGAIAHILRAIGLDRGWTLKTHRQTLDVGEHIGYEFGDLSVSLAVEQANALHANYYENRFTEDGILETIEKVEDALPQLEQMLREPPRPFTIRNRSDRRRLARLTGNQDLQVGDSSPVGFSLNHPST